MRNMATIFRKQLKDTLKNKTVLIQFVLLPALTFVMTHTVQIQDMPEHFFVTLFASMYIGMAPLTSMAAVIAEEREQNTLRVLLMSNVKPWEYLAGVGSYIWLMCMAGAGVICAADTYSAGERLVFMGVMAAGIFVSLLTGAAVGAWSRTQMMAISLSLPVMIVFSFAPMLSLFNRTVANIARFLYSEQISRMLHQVGQFRLTAESVCVIAANMLLAAVLFAAAYRKSGLA